MRVKQYDFRMEIQERMHPAMAGMKKEPGLTWCCGALERLNNPDCHLTVDNFMTFMGNSRTINGFLLEVMTANALLDHLPTTAIRTEILEGTAKVPVDITARHGNLRIDFSCKTMQSVENELHITELASWLKTEGGDAGLVGWFDLQVVKSATEDQLNEFREWFRQNLSSVAFPLTLYWPIDSPLLEVVIDTPDATLFETQSTFMPRFIWSPVDHIGMAQSEELSSIKGKLVSRIQESRRSFGFKSSPQSANLVVVDLPAGGITNEHSFCESLYGQRSYRIFGGGGEGQATITSFRDTSSALFANGKFEYVSAIAVCREQFSPVVQFELALFPHPKHIHACQALLAIPCFRLAEGLEIRDGDLYVCCQSSSFSGCSSDFLS